MILTFSDKATTFVFKNNNVIEFVPTMPYFILFFFLICGCLIWSHLYMKIKKKKKKSAPLHSFLLLWNFLLSAVTAYLAVVEGKVIWTGVTWLSGFPGSSSGLNFSRFVMTSQWTVILALPKVMIPTNALTPFHDNVLIRSVTVPQHMWYVMKLSLCPGWVPMATAVCLLKG